jgi:hypothetical protein
VIVKGDIVLELLSILSSRVRVSSDLSPPKEAVIHLIDLLSSPVYQILFPGSRINHLKKNSEKRSDLEQQYDNSVL